MDKALILGTAAFAIDTIAIGVGWLLLWKKAGAAEAKKDGIEFLKIKYMEEGSKLVADEYKTLNTAFIEFRAITATQNHSMSKTLDKIDYRLNNLSAQMQNLASGGAGIIKSFGKEHGDE